MKPSGLIICALVPLLNFFGLPDRLRQEEQLPATSTDSLVDAAASQYAEGAFQHATRTLSQIPVDRLTARGAYYLGASYAALGDFQIAARYLRQAAASPAAPPWYRNTLARTLAQGGLYREARTAYEALLDGEAPYLPALPGYGALLYDEGEFAGAAATFERALQENPRDHAVGYLLGSCLDRLGQSDSAIAYLAASVSLNPDYTPAVSLLASLHFNRRNYNAALLLYERLCKQRPRYADYWYKAGLCSEHLRSDQLAIDLFRRAAAIDTTEALYRAHLGQVFFGLGRLDSALTSYREAVRLDPDNPVLLLNMGLCLARMDSTAAAVSAFRRSAAAHQVEKASLPLVQMGAVFYNKKRYREARGAYARALTYDPGNMEALFFIGFTHEQARDFRAARSAFRKYIAAAAGDSSLVSRVTTVKERLRKLPPAP